jgi:hypothetical protein
VKGDYFIGFRYIIGDGNKACFWHDLWMGNCPLKIRSTHIFEVCNQQDWSVNRVCNQGNVLLSFKRNLGEREELELAELSDLLEGVQLSKSKDSVKWIFERFGIFSTSSLYNELTFTGFPIKWLLCLWKTKIPLKIRIFLRQVINDKIRSAKQLKIRNWSGSTECKLCGQIGTTNHIFFHCALAYFCWCVCRDVLEWSFPPTCPHDIYNLCRESSNRQTKNIIYLFGCLAWSLWLIRNEFVFQNLVVSSPNVGLFRAISFLQK